MLQPDENTLFASNNVGDNVTTELRKIKEQAYVPTIQFSVTSVAQALLGYMSCRCYKFWISAIDTTYEILGHWKWHTCRIWVAVIFDYLAGIAKRFVYGVSVCKAIALVFRHRHPRSQPWKELSAKQRMVRELAGQSSGTYLSIGPNSQRYTQSIPRLKDPRSALYVEGVVL